MHYLILASTLILATYAVISLHSRNMIYNTVPANRRRRH